jgi:hypothetical protein
MKDIRLILEFIKEDIKELLLFIKWIPAYYKLHRNYRYEPDTYHYIIQNYEQVLCNTTRTMSKPTYDWRAVVSEIDRYYEVLYREEN